jgi:hypothetical protein
MRRSDRPLRTALTGAVVLLCFGLGVGAGVVYAQEEFQAHDSGDVFQSHDEPDTGVGGRTGTQGVVGNPFCPPPTIIVNGVPTHPRNWSCKVGGNPGPVRPMVIGPGANACLPFGKGGYDYCQNPAGTRLPPGCSCGRSPRLKGYVESGRHDSATKIPKGFPAGVEASLRHPPTPAEGGATMRYLHRDPGLPPDEKQPNVEGVSRPGGWKNSSTTDNQRAEKTLQKIADEKNQDPRAKTDVLLTDIHNKLNGHRVAEPLLNDTNHSHITGPNGSSPFNGSNMGSGSIPIPAKDGPNGATANRGNTTAKTGHGAHQVATLKKTTPASANNRSTKAAEYSKYNTQYHPYGVNNTQPYKGY